VAGTREYRRSPRSSTSHLLAFLTKFPCEVETHKVEIWPFNRCAVARSTGRCAEAGRRGCLGSHGCLASAVAAAQERYDCGMTKSKIAITLPQDQLARVHREVRAGRADSVSGYIARVLAEQEERESLRVLLLDLIEQHGQPGAEETKWAKSALAPHRRG